MKKQSIINLIRYHYEKNENEFRNEAINICREFDSLGDYQLSEYILGLMNPASVYVSQEYEFQSEFLKKWNTTENNPLYLPLEISDDIKGIINAVNHNVGINKFLFEGMPGSGKTEAAKQIARLLNRNLYYVDFNMLIDSKLGQTNKNIVNLFEEIAKMPNADRTVILFDEIDVIALNRISSNDVREMGRVTSNILKEFDKLTEIDNNIVIIATTNLYKKFDKALTRRFDAVINFDRYTREDLIEIAEYYFDSFIKKFKNVSKDTRLLKKILKTADTLPYPGELKNIIKISLAFSSPEEEWDYLRRLYNNIIGNIEKTDIKKLHEQKFTTREIEKLKGESKSNVSRKLCKNSQ